MEKINYKELVELFFVRSLPELSTYNEGFRVNFLFLDDVMEYVEYVKNNPFLLSYAWSPSIQDKHIEYINKIDYDSPTIIVRNYENFFKLLQEIVNANLEMYDDYMEHRSARNLAMSTMVRIWLRMGHEDFNDVELFLKKQLEFCKNNMFDEYKNYTFIDTMFDCEVFAKTALSATWDETPRTIRFTLKNDYGNYNLPKIHFAIEEDTCYIYGIQNIKNPCKNKKIERLLYKLNNGFKDTNVHPSFVAALLIFLRLLNKRGITKIKVPINQVLSYDYHIFMSNRIKENFEFKWNKEKFDYVNVLSESLKEDYMREYNEDLAFYKHVVNNYDCISKNKIDNLINLIMRLQDMYDNFIIHNDIDIHGSYFDISFGEKNIPLELIKR